MKSPFKFLDSYAKEDREIFFGRDLEIEELYQRVFENKILLVYGISGTGKSSLIHCGLANKFQETDWLPLVIRRGSNIIESMAAAIKAASVTVQQSDIVTPTDFKKGLRSLYLDHYKPVFFIFDQFEELFIFGNKEERKAFIHIIKSLTESSLQCRIIFIMREEYMAGITEFEKYIPTIFSNRIRIEKMSHANALEAIKGPCKKFSITIEDGFAEALLEKLSPGETEIELTYLQVFLDKIYKQVSDNLVHPEKDQNGMVNPESNLSFTLDLLEKTGNVSDILGNFLDEQLSLMDEPEIALALLKSFVSVKGTKQQMKSVEIKEYSFTLGKDVSEAFINEMIQVFVNLRILSDKNQDLRYELRHDALAAKIYEKFTLAEKELLEVRRFLENAYSTFENRGIYLKKDDLDYLAVYENRLILPRHLQDFIRKSHQELISKQRILTLISRITLIVFILIIAAVVRVYLRSKSNLKEKNLISVILLQSESDPYGSLMKTLTLWEKYNTSTVLHKLILNNFQNLLISETDTSNALSMLKKVIEPKILISPVVKADINKEGSYIFGWMENQQVFIYDLHTGKIYYISSTEGLIHLEISEKDSLVAMINDNNNGYVIDFQGNIHYYFTTTNNSVMNDRLVCFIPSGYHHLAAIKENSAVIYNKTGVVVDSLIGHNDRINSVDISPDGSFIVTASCDKKCYIWNFDKSINKFSVYDTLIGHNDTVWSCEFNRTGKYIITASTDSTVRIWDLNGNQRDAQFNFGYNYEETRRYKMKYGEYDDDIEDSNLSPYYRKLCNATFSKDELSIVATGYTLTDDLNGPAMDKYNQVMYYDIDSKFNKFNYTPFSDILYTEDEKIIPEVFNTLAISPAGETAAACITKNNIVYILAADGLQLAEKAGRFALYSNDGRYLYIINKNSISKFPVDILEIKDLITKYVYTESPEPIKGIKSVL